MTDSQKLDLLLTGMQEMKQDIHLLREDVGTLNNRVQRLEDRVQKLEDRIQKLEDRVQKLEDRVQKLENNFQTLNTNVQTLNKRMDVLESKMIHTELILENEIRPSIQRVAEGHFDLSRNLHEALKPSHEMEMLSIRVNVLESDVKDLKSKLA